MPLTRPSGSKGRRAGTRCRRLRSVAAALALVVLLCGCGAEGENLPSSVRSSLPSSVGTTAESLPGSLPSSLPGSLPTRPDSSPPSGTTPPSQPDTTPSPPASSSVTPPPPATSTPATTPTVTENTTAIVPTSAAAEGSSSSTPWGWILLVAALLVVAAGVAAWAIGRRGAARKSWKTQAFHASVQGTALHDDALAELIASNDANRPERWTALAGDAGDLSMSLQTLEASSPAPPAAMASQTMLDAVTGFRSALTVAGSAPRGLPLDPEAGRTVRQRLEQLALAVEGLRARTQS